MPNEESLYNEISSSLAQFSIIEKENISNMEETKVLKNQNSEDITILVRFINSVPKFVGTDSNIYGPFIKEDIANLPEKTAQILINKNRAEKIQHENS